jgi:hypothetical protein
MHRGFTKGSSPLNSALPVEETYRENADSKNECQLVLLDAKSAFDIVISMVMLYISADFPVLMDLILFSNSDNVATGIALFLTS